MHPFTIELGKGSWGTVYKTEDQKAVKIFKDSHIFISTSEIDILFRLKSPYLLKGLEIASFGKELGIVMELGQKTLRELKKSLSTEELVDISYQLTAGTLYLHSQGYYHLDLNTSNCLCLPRTEKPNYQVKIIDFGLSGATSNNSNYISKSQRVTVTERPPECFHNTVYSDKVDVWSLGMVFIEIFAKELPYIVDWEHTSESFKKDNAILYYKYKNSKSDKYIKLNQKIYENCIPTQIFLLFSDSSRDIYIKKAFEQHFPNSSWLVLLSQMLTYNPLKRISLIDVLNHEIFKESKILCDEVFHPEIIIESDDYDLSALTTENLLQIKSILSYMHEINNISFEALFIAIELALKIFALKSDKNNFKNYILTCISISLRIFELKENISFAYYNSELEIEVLSLLKGQIRNSLLWNNCKNIFELNQLYNYIFSDVEILKKYFLIDYTALISKLENTPQEGKNFSIKVFSIKLKAEK